MSSPEHTARKPSRQRWTVPAVSVVIGIAYFVAGWLGGNHEFAVVGLALMLVTGAASMVLGRYSETVAGLLDRRDERINSIDRDATTFAGIVVITAIILGFVVQVARGEDSSTYAMLGALGGVAYVLALIVLRFRR